jgi:hypothetical protein
MRLNPNALLLQLKHNNFTSDSIQGRTGLPLRMCYRFAVFPSHPRGYLTAIQAQRYVASHVRAPKGYVKLHVFFMSILNFGELLSSHLGRLTPGALTKWKIRPFCMYSCYPAASVRSLHKIKLTIKVHESLTNCGFPLYPVLPSDDISFYLSAVFKLCTHKKLWLPHQPIYICWRQGCNGIRNQFSSLYITTAVYFS